MERPSSSATWLYCGRIETLGRHDLLATWRALVEGRSAAEAALAARLEREAGITTATGDVLVRLLAADQHVLPTTTLAAQVSFSSGGFTKFVDRLVERGLVERKACLSDRRIVYVALTERGRTVALRAVDATEALVREELLPALGAERMADLRRSMELLRDALV